MYFKKEKVENQEKRCPNLVLLEKSEELDCVLTKLG